MQVFDGRTLRELSTFRGHPKDVATAAWHPWQQEAFVSGDFDGNLCHWLMSHSRPQAGTLLHACEVALEPPAAEQP